MRAATMRQSPATALSREHYIDEKIYAVEKDALFYQTWQFAGHISQIPNPGDYLTFAICDQSLFLVRNEGGGVSAFHNVCMHRAHQLVTGTGNLKAIVCPYHAWTYSLNGKLRRAPNQDKVAGFDASTIALEEVQTENFLGFVFVNLNPQSPGMDHWYPGVRAQLRAFLPNLSAFRHCVG